MGNYTYTFYFFFSNYIIYITYYQNWLNTHLGLQENFENFFCFEFNIYKEERSNYTSVNLTTITLLYNFKLNNNFLKIIIRLKISFT